MHLKCTNKKLIKCNKVNLSILQSDSSYKLTVTLDTRYLNYFTPDTMPTSLIKHRLILKDIELVSIDESILPEYQIIDNVLYVNFTVWI